MVDLNPKPDDWRREFELLTDLMEGHYLPQLRRIASGSTPPNQRGEELLSGNFENLDLPLRVELDKEVLTEMVASTFPDDQHKITRIRPCRQPWKGRSQYILHPNKRMVSIYIALETRSIHKVTEPIGRNHERPHFQGPNMTAVRGQMRRLL
ncbi:hypothetical protein BDM02DRAFT_3169773 [Thelephora ganbajun]|uniref:Uncharacterized protein n=1 Tax=Thelephora ganbajun TaxID=370292 RepID=A0ACB6ZEK7_THEGA|nr:hypothetical protein BDM02DRAFT_3169773 [Thelephora ganbajun]